MSIELHKQNKENIIKKGLLWIYTNLVKPIVTPIEYQLMFFILLYFLLISLDIFQMIYVSSYIPLRKSIYGIAICYIILLPLVFIKQKFKTYYKITVITISTLLFVIDLGLLKLYGNTFSTIFPDAVIVTRETNLSEAIEFVSTYFNLTLFLIVIAVTSPLFILYILAKKIQIRFSPLIRILIFLILSFSSIFYIDFLSRYKENNYYLLFTMKRPNLKEYRQTPLVLQYEVHPQNIVLIIGESFSKLHSSLYGYEKQTSPCMEKLKDKGELIIYDNVKSSATYTILSFRGLMMSYAEDICDNTEWFRRLTIFDVMKQTEYKTYWISNQYKFDEVGRYSLLCDEHYFVSDYNDRLEKYHLDEKVLPLLENVCKNGNGDTDKFIIIHLGGSHVDYEKRYPNEFSRFNTDDYNVSHQHLSQNNRKLIAEYDNSVLYNDFIVYSIIQRFKDENAIVIYLSDHGEELFETNNDFFGHGITSNPDIVLNIPFMIYTTPLFKENHRSLQTQIEQSIQKDYRSDSLMYTIMDIAGIDSVSNTSYKHKSLLY